MLGEPPAPPAPAAPRARHAPLTRMLTGQLRYQLRLLVRSPAGAFFTLVIPLMLLLAVTMLTGTRHFASRGNIDFAQFFVPAMVAFAVANACYMQVLTSTALARERGILKRIRGTPLPPWVYMAARVGSAALVAVVSALVVIGVGAGLYGFVVVWPAVPGVLLTTAVAILTFCALALAITVLIPGSEAAMPFAWGTLLPLCFISDIFLPLDDAPGWLRTVASAFPLRPFADDLESAFNPALRGASPNWRDLAVIAAWGIAATVFALVAFRWDPRVVRRHPRRLFKRGS